MRYIEVASPSRKVITTKQEYINFIKLNNGITNLYRTVYAFKYLKNKYQINYESAIIIEMFFDCDSKNSWNVIKKFHEYLIKKNIKHYMKQSSYMKFHIYVLCEECDLKNKKNALYNSMAHLANENKFTFGDSAVSDLDKSTFGDLARICPIAGTYKPKRKSYCSYINKEDLYSEILLKERAKHGNGKKKIYGDNYFNMKPFDNMVVHKTNTTNIVVDNDNFNVQFNDKFIEGLPPFIKKILMNYKGYCDNYKNRWRVALYMRDIGFPESLTESICKEYFSKYLNWTSLNGRGTQWDRFVKCNALWYVYNGEFREFPTVDNLLQEDLEVTKEDEVAINNLYGK